MPAELGRAVLNRPLDLSFTPLARMDIKEIAQYTSELWGEEQADRYSGDLFREAERLTRLPHVGGVLEGPREPTRALPVGRHVLIYRVLTSEILILRVIHERRITRMLIRAL